MSKLIDIDKLFKALEAKGTDLSDDGNYYNDAALEGYSRYLLNKVINSLPNEMSAVETVQRFCDWCTHRRCNKCSLYCECRFPYREDVRPPSARAFAKWVQEHPEEAEE